jgi:hypothetical protein
MLFAFKFSEMFDGVQVPKLFIRAIHCFFNQLFRIFILVKSNLKQFLNDIVLKLNFIPCIDESLLPEGIRLLVVEGGLGIDLVILILPPFVLGYNETLFVFSFFFGSFLLLLNLFRTHLLLDHLQ